MAGMSWGELDLELGVWSLPASRTKNRRAHTVHLSVLSIELLSSLKLFSNGAEFVFESNQKQGTPIHPDSLTTALSNLQAAKKDNKEKEQDNKEKEPGVLDGVPAFTVHDLRRSAATSWGEHLKIMPHVIERMLNHQPQNKLVATYQRASYVDEQKAAWLEWGILVELEVANEPSNVVSINNKKGVILN